MVTRRQEYREAPGPVGMAQQRIHQHVVQTSLIQRRIADVVEHIEGAPLPGDAIGRDGARIKIAIEVQQVAGNHQDVGLLRGLISRGERFDQFKQSIEAIAQVVGRRKVGGVRRGRSTWQLQKVGRRLGQRILAYVDVNIGQVTNLECSGSTANHRMPGHQAVPGIDLLPRQPRGRERLTEVELVKRGVMRLVRIFTLGIQEIEDDLILILPGIHSLHLGTVRIGLRHRHHPGKCTHLVALLKNEWVMRHAG
ncbi:hypothetical protein D3C72_1636580 [compost metagenome]